MVTFVPGYIFLFFMTFKCHTKWTQKKSERGEIMFHSTLDPSLFKTCFFLNKLVRFVFYHVSKIVSLLSVSEDISICGLSCFSRHTCVCFFSHVGYKGMKTDSWQTCKQSNILKDWQVDIQTMPDALQPCHLICFLWKGPGELLGTHNTNYQPPRTSPGS